MALNMPFAAEGVTFSYGGSFFAEFQQSFGFGELLFQQFALPESEARVP